MLNELFLCYSQKMTHQSSKLSIVMTELKLADTVNYKASLMALINAIINCTQDLLHRNRIRNEFIGKYKPKYFYTFLITYFGGHQSFLWGH